MRVPLTFGKNRLHSCPELVRQKPYDMLDCCAHDMWGAGYLMHRTLTNTSPWWFPSCGDEWEDCKQLCKLHEEWVSPCCPFPSSLSGMILLLPVLFFGGMLLLSSLVKPF